jgi:hypothetical protein
MTDEELGAWREVAQEGSATGECAGDDLRRLIARMDAAEDIVRMRLASIPLQRMSQYEQRLVRKWDGQR